MSRTTYNSVFMTLLAAAIVAMLIAGPVQADPLPGRDTLKFSQLPMNGTTVFGDNGVVDRFYGHDELSTAYSTIDAVGTPTAYTGTFMADDFADKFNSPVVHIKWWGSYLNNFTSPDLQVDKFLISFESDVPAGTDEPFSHPGVPLLNQIVARGPLSPGSGTFTENQISLGGAPLNEHLFEYNAELHLGQEFFQQPDTVYWLKIVALIDLPAGVDPANAPQWGWHNRDYSVNDPLASVAPQVVPGEYIEGYTGPAFMPTPVWHFQDDAVTGNITFDPWVAPGIPIQDGYQPTHYLSLIDGPPNVEQYSKDLAFQLYTISVPEPASLGLAGLGMVLMAACARRRRRSGSSQGGSNMRTWLVVAAIIVSGFLPGEAWAVQKEIFGLASQPNGFHILRYDVIGDSFYDCGTVASNAVPTTNLAMDANRRLYYMYPFQGGHDIWKADLDGSNNLINQQYVNTLAVSQNLSIIDGFTIGPNQDLYMTGYGHSEIYRYDLGVNNGLVTTEVKLIAGPSGTTGEFRSDLAFDPLTNYLVGIGIVPDGSGRRSLFQIPNALVANGLTDSYVWEFFGGNSSPWASATFDLGSPTNPSGPLGPNPDGVAFDPINGDLYLSGDGEKFSLWDRSNATLTNYLVDPLGQDTGLGYDLAFQTVSTVPEPATWALAGIGAIGLIGFGRRRRRRSVGRDSLGGPTARRVAASSVGVVLAVLASCLVLSTNAMADNWTMTITVDNQYDVYFGDQFLSVPTYAGGDNSWFVPETWNVVGVNPIDFLYVATASDHSVAQGFLGEFTNTTTSNTFVTSDDVTTPWEVFPAGNYLPALNALDPSIPAGVWPMSVQPTMSQVQTAVSYATLNNLWITPTSVPGYNNGSSPSPWGTVAGISGSAEWIWYDSGLDTSMFYPVPFQGFNHAEFLVFRVPGVPELHVPEPTTACLSLVGMAALALVARRRRTA